MTADNNQVPNDPLDMATDALRSAAPGDDRPSPALVAATIAALQALEAKPPNESSDERKSPVPAPSIVQLAEPAVLKPVVPYSEAPSRGFRRAVLWASALAAAVLIAVVITRPSNPPRTTSTEERQVGEIVIIEVNPAEEFTRMDERLAQAQNEVTALTENAERLVAQERIARILADDHDLLGSSRSN